MEKALITHMKRFEKELIEFIPLAEEIYNKAQELDQILESERDNITNYTLQEIKEADSIGIRIDELCHKVSEMF